MAQLQFSMVMVRPVTTAFEVGAGTAINAAECPKPSNGSAFFGPVWLPFCLDPTYPIRVQFLIARGIGLIDNGKVVEFTLSARSRRNAGQSALITRTFQYAPEDDWPANDPRLIEVFNGTDPCFPGNSFELTDLLGLILQRNAASTEDTYARSIIIHGALLLTGTSRCRSMCC